MKKGMYKMLATALMLTISGGVVGNAADTVLDTVYVNADRDQAELQPLGSLAYQTQNVGLLGNKDALDTPFTSMSVSRKSIDTFASPMNGVMDALALNPSVRPVGGAIANEVSIRGFKVSDHSLYVNGIPGLLDQQKLTDVYIENANVISGPNIGVAATTSNQAVSGTIDFQSKRAQSTPNTDLKLTYRGGSSFQQMVDVGKRFGDNQRWGVRVMADNIDGETAVKGEKLTQRDIFVNIDQKTEHSKTNILAGYNYNKQTGMISYGVGFSDKLTRLPDAVDGSRIYAPDWALNEYDNWILAFNHEQKLNEHATAFVNAGYHREDWYGYLDGSVSVKDDEGHYSYSANVYPLGVTKKYLGLGLKGKFNIGASEHDYSVSVDRNWKTSYGGSWENAFGAGKSNYQIGYDTSATDNEKTKNSTYYAVLNSLSLKNPSSGTNPGINPYAAPCPKSQEMTINGWNIIDTISFANGKYQIVGGLHGQSLKKHSVKNGVNKTEDKYSDVSPTWSLLYKPTDHFTAYFSHTENFFDGSLVSTALNSTYNVHYENAGQYLDPYKYKQNEFGVKYKSGNLLHTLSYFKIEKPNYGDVWKDGKLYYAEFGKQKNKGIEYSFAGSAGSKFDIVGGFTYLNTKQATQDANNGKWVNGVPQWSATAGVVFKPSENVHYMARARYMGHSYIQNEKLKVPSFFLFDVGADYTTKLNETPVTFKAMVYNLFDKKYWNPMNSNSLAIGMPRTFTLSAEFRF